ncbi:Nif3-like dinuclear metal center hexameric protein [Lentilactobacillus otakiensis]|uniref:GTP cyclohydrolase 1 type 2 homolog n=1 Tax=Lentilactobacillus otakiensis DSM 19908 = JCM 15040 TaxID=1423780 RepID=S4NB03_9LACO|nr:Nif3-like dinuclear metal center hexameric protein [Lentilactobacillus otakiensis]KRL09137.1 NGG1p interacting factor 3 protein, NIF3 [Lentilactobacillus otakiensis DSM 19908 = JCM 15040]MBZ3775753.1 Nif3-like dinuclear metal center hexameric protein [Lentilactobacillus otakiensis]GAD15864.1 NGG1p interacting factor 3 protein, NIF3 [Lentilactobacillus otakiensis DSM 19908 = JCM 15040]
MKARDLVERFEQFAPKKLAMDKDPVGLQIGSLDQEIHKVMTTLDVRPEVVDEAIDNDVDFIFAHHPVMFHPAHNLDLDDPQNAMYAKIIANHITVYAAHTNLDSADGGMNDWLAESLQLSHLTGLVPAYDESVFRLTVQVQKVYAAAVRMSLVDAGAQASADQYSGYTYEIDGTVYYVPKAGADPTMGAAGEPNEIEDSRLEFEVPEKNLHKVLRTLADVHPLEKPLYNLIRLEDKKHHFTMGRIGDLPRSMTVKEFAEYCKQVFSVSGLRVIAKDLTKPIQRIAILGGDGGKFFHLAQQKGADAYVTGDVYYHTGHDMLAADFPVIDPGHHIESICIPKLASMFKRWSDDNDWHLDVYQSKINTDPFTFM